MTFICSVLECALLVNMETSMADQCILLLCLIVVKMGLWHV